jgi:hypothetical protein
VPLSGRRVATCTEKSRFFTLWPSFGVLHHGVTKCGRRCCLELIARGLVQMEEFTRKKPVTLNMMAICSCETSQHLKTARCTDLKLLLAPTRCAAKESLYICAFTAPSELPSCTQVRHNQAVDSATSDAVRFKKCVLNHRTTQSHYPLHPAHVLAAPY